MRQQGCSVKSNGVLFRQEERAIAGKRSILNTELKEDSSGKLDDLFSPNLKLATVIYPFVACKRLPLYAGV